VASQLFQIRKAAILPLSVLRFSYADDEAPDLAFKMQIWRPTIQQLGVKEEIMRRRLNDCTKGLLEPSKGPMYYDRKVYGSVEYPYRTVRDFLDREDISTELRRVTKDSFNPNMRLC
jgi:hypothetical protein